MKVHNLLVTGSLTSGGENISTISSSVSTTVTELSSSLNSRLDGIQTSTGSLNTFTSSANNRLNSVETSTGSLNTFTSSANNRLNSIESVTGSYATTGSNTFNGNLTVTGFIDAQELRTTYISSSILYRSGSTKFGDELTDTHAFTGSMLLSGSLTVNGTSTIQNTLTLNGSNNVIRSGNELRFNRADNAVYTRLYDAGSLAANGFILDNINGEGFHFQNNGTTIMRMNSSGNVGIGTNSPSKRLDVSVGDENVLRLQRTGASARQWDINIKPNFTIGDNTAAADRFTIDTSGNVGIGVTSPTAQLSIKNQISNGSNPVSSYAATSGVDGQNFFNGYYALNSDGLGPYPRFFDIVSTGSPDGTNGGSNIRFFTNPVATSSPAVERMRISSGGNVGIGASTPSTKLHIVDNFDPDDALGYLLVENTNTTSGSPVTNSALNVKNYHGTSQFMQWEENGLRIGSRILTNGGVGDVIFTAGADSEKLRILAGGGITFNGDTAAANALDDYEEGTWTPRLTGGGGEATYTSRRGWYTKIGRHVTVIWQIYFQKNNMSGTMRMNDLPFTLLSDNSSFYPQGTVLMDTLASTVNNITFQPGNGSNSGDFIQGNGGTLNHEGFSISNLSNSTMLTRGTVTYFTV